MEVNTNYVEVAKNMENLTEISKTLQTYWTEVSDVVVVSEEQYQELVSDFTVPRDYLKGKGKVIVKSPNTGVKLVVNADNKGYPTAVGFIYAIRNWHKHIKMTDLFGLVSIEGNSQDEDIFNVHRRTVQT